MRRVLVTGATGYIGGRLVPRLLEAGYTVRCLVRNPEKLRSRTWIDEPGLEIFQGDVANRAEVERAMTDCHAAYYLVHSMMAVGADYRERDYNLARNIARSARSANIERIVYLGGLGEMGENLSEHLTSRREVEAVLGSTGVPVTVLRAAMIIGSGSASFEILRYLVDRLPVMITPRWVKSESQPISVRNVLHYLVECLNTPETIGQTLDIGGPDVIRYRDLMDVMSDALGLRRRWVIPVPVLTPRLSSLWIHLVTPLSARIARPLAEGLRNRVVCRDNRAAELMPQQLLTVQEAIDAALGKYSTGAVETKWSDAGRIPGDPDWAGGDVFVDRRTTEVEAPVEEVFAAVCRLGGAHGYHGSDWLWGLRGWLDRMVGGPGLRRGRRHPQELAFGDALDFWRVTGLEAPLRLELRAEMKLPGEAKLSFDLEPPSAERKHCRLTQTARFKPRGLFGLCYWYGVVPLHGLVFPAMLNGIKAEAEAAQGGGPADSGSDSGGRVRRRTGTASASSTA